MSKITENDTGKQDEMDSESYLNEHGYAKLNLSERKEVVAAFKKTGIEIKQKSFDALNQSAFVKFKADNDVSEIVLYKLKTAGINRKSVVNADFTGLGFTLTSSERQNAEQLGLQHRFMFINLKTKQHTICSIGDFFNENISRIYPTWSVFVQKSIPINH